MPKHQLNNAPISKTRNAASVTAVATTALVRRLSGCPANPDCNGGSSKASPINLFHVSKRRKINEDVRASKFDSRQSRKKPL